MAFAPTPPRKNAPSQLLPLGSILTHTGNGSGGGSSASIALTSPPTNGTSGTALSLTGTVSPSGIAVQVGLSASASIGPTSWTNATVSGAGWTASVLPGATGTYYIWVEQTSTPSVHAVSAAVTIASSSSGSIAFSSPPITGTQGIALSLVGTVSPSAAAVQVGLSTSETVAPTSWTGATVSGTSWTALLTPSAAGTFYFWAEQTNTTFVQTVSAAVTVASSSSSSGGSALSYSLISGSGNGSLTGVTLTTGTAYTVDWTSIIAAGATDVRPGIVVSSIGAISACSFWFDTSATNATVPTSDYGNAGSLNNSQINFYANNTGFGTPTACPAAPSNAGTYYGKYAMYNSSDTLLGVFVTSAITIT